MNADIKIGQHFFQYSFPGILEYEVTGISELKTIEHTELFYIVKCLSCRDHVNCIVAFKKDNDGNLEYSHMLNGYDIDEEYYSTHHHYKNNQYYWHKTENKNIFSTKKEAQKSTILKNIDSYNESIKKWEESILQCKEKIKEALTQISILDE